MGITHTHTHTRIHIEAAEEDLRNEAEVEKLQEPAKGVSESPRHKAINQPLETSKEGARGQRSQLQPQI